jgi:hypothetical protein
MKKRTRRTLVVVAAVLVLLAVAVFLRSKAPPEAARLLPESDGILYANLKPVHTFFKSKLEPPRRVPEYEDFVQATGVDWERDLDQVAIALHRMPDPNGPNGPVAYSMVLVGRLTGAKLNLWLEARAESRETYAGHTIYNVPSEGRTVRVTQVGYDMLAVSNAPTTEQIHSMLDRHRTAALPFAGSTLLSRHYHDVPLLALAWGVGQIGLPFNENGAISVLGFRLPLQADSTIVAGLSPELSLSSVLRLRVEEIAATNEDAVNQAAALSTLVTLARGFAEPLSGNAANKGLKEVLKSAEVTQTHNRVIIRATVPVSMLAGLAGGDNSAAEAAAEPATDASK